MIKYKVAVIEDCQATQNWVKDSIERAPGVEVTIFDGPKEFLMKGGEWDLIFSDWSFPYNTLEFFSNGVDKTKLIILTGGEQEVKIDCLAVLHKRTHMFDLGDIAQRYIMQIRNSSS